MAAVFEIFFFLMFEEIIQQEHIAEAVCWGVSAWRGCVCLPREVCLGRCLPREVSSRHPLVDRILDTRL